MSNLHVRSTNFILICFTITLIQIHVSFCQGIEYTSNNEQNSSNVYRRLFRRSSGKRCFNTSDCATEISGSVCVQNTCVCPQGYLPSRRGIIGCFQMGKFIGSSCNSSAQCGDDLTCKSHTCRCPEGFQLFQTPENNFCLFWHRPTRLVDRCRTNDDCTKQDPNAVCKKRWCQCNAGHQLFETMLFGRRHRCFATMQQTCSHFTHCSGLEESPEHFCTCYMGVCHCLYQLNFTSFDIPSWSEQPSWYQRWRKDLILVTRLLFVTVILFFVPCFIYVTLGMRERGRALFSSLVQPSRSPIVHYAQPRRGSRPQLAPYRGVTRASLESPFGGVTSARASLESPFGGITNTRQSRNVEISLNTSGVNSRLVSTSSRPRVQTFGTSYSMRTLEAGFKDEDPPPSYDEIMHKEAGQEEPPPPYREP